jgi:transcription termination factor NusB
VQLDIVRQDCGRLSTENNQLHQKLIQESERYEALQKEAYQRSKKLESQIAELTYWKQQAITRCARAVLRTYALQWSS